MSCRECSNKFCTNKVLIFSSFSCEELENIYQLIDHRKLKKGEILLQDGEEMRNLFILNEGRLKCYRYTKDGREQILNIIKDGDCIGELQLLKGKTFDGYVQAVVDSNICTLKKEEFQNLLFHNPAMSLKILELVGERLQQLEGLAVALADKDGEVKLAYILDELVNDYGSQEGNKITIHLPITKEEMAFYAGVTRETLSRKLKAFSDLGIIRMVGHKQIDVLDYEALKDYL
jgi:CRP/FNR family transcriptional regulator, anaerobic regulatory protein